MPAVVAITALDPEVDSLRVAICEPVHAEKGGTYSATDVSGNDFYVFLSV